MGYGSRPASAMSRPQTSLGTRKLHGSSISMSRPATSLDHHDDNAGSVLGKRKGMQRSIFSPTHSPFCPIGPMDSRLHNSRLEGSRSVSTSGMDTNRLAQGTQGRMPYLPGGSPVMLVPGGLHQRDRASGPTFPFLPHLSPFHCSPCPLSASPRGLPLHVFSPKNPQ